VKTLVPHLKTRLANLDAFADFQTSQQTGTAQKSQFCTPKDCKTQIQSPSTICATETQWTGNPSAFRIQENEVSSSEFDFGEDFDLCEALMSLTEYD